MGITLWLLGGLSALLVGFGAKALTRGNGGTSSPINNLFGGQSEKVLESLDVELGDIDNTSPLSTTSAISSDEKMRPRTAQFRATYYDGGSSNNKGFKDKDPKFDSKLLVDGAKAYGIFKVVKSVTNVAEDVGDSVSDTARDLGGTVSKGIGDYFGIIVIVGLGLLIYKVVDNG